MSLNPRQQAFVLAYPGEAAAAAAFRSAGYSCRTAHAAEANDVILQSREYAAVEGL